jgi:hypothetical protein
LFTIFGQQTGFTCSIEDMLLKNQGEMQRKHLLDEANLEGHAVAAKFTGKEDEHAIQKILAGL